MSDPNEKEQAAIDAPVESAPTRVLIADDSKTSRHILGSLLQKWGYEVIACNHGGEALERLTEPGAPRLAILDWTMPELDGVQLCRRIRAQGQRHDYQYLILLTARSESEDLVEGLEAGADDYVAKPFDREELRVRVRAGARIVALHAELAAAQAILHRQATRDPLTGALNRRAIRDELTAELSRAQREDQPVSVIIADVDHFKQVNDNHGHQVGDEVLCQLVERWERALRPYDHVGRWGGEEFLLVMPGASSEPDVGLFDRLRLAIGERPFSTSAGEVAVSASLGVATWSNDVDLAQWQRRQEQILDALVARADEALYRAKANGRDRVEYAA